MATSLFDAASQGLEQHTDFDRLEARGTLRIALKESGLDANQVTHSQLVVVFAKIMPGPLQARGVEDGSSVCQAVVVGLSESDYSKTGSSADEVFSRLGGG